MFRNTALGLFTLAFSAVALAAPTCYDHGSAIDVDNDQVVKWKSTTENEFTARAHVSGKVTKIYKAHDGHAHFQATIGDSDDATVELIFNDDFGTHLNPTVGQSVEACGDYITSIAVTQYPISPDHGLIHWLHENPHHHGHDDGWLVLDGRTFGVR